MKRVCAFFLALLLTAALLPLPARAGSTLTVDDQAELLTAAEREALIDRYSEITEYMEAAFVSTAHASGSTVNFAERYAIAHYGNEPAVIFVIDMDNRQIYIYANGTAQRTISRADARAITDNIYREASRGNYFACAEGAFQQILSRCQGERLSRPVKHITNALIAMLAGVLINYLMLASSRRPRKARRTKGTVSASARRTSSIPGIVLGAPLVLKSERHYKESSSSGGGGGGGGGGGHSGGGGGHSF